MKQLLETPETGINPLYKLWFHRLSGCWCRSQTAIGLTHILAFCVYIHDDDVCKQQGKNPVFISTMIPAKPFPPQLHQQSLGMWPEPQSAVGTVVTTLCHSAPTILTLHPRPPAGLALQLPKPQICPNLGTPGTPLPCPSILTLCDSASIFHGSGKPALAHLSHDLYPPRSKLFNVVLLALVLSLTLGLFLSHCPFLSPTPLP